MIFTYAHSSPFSSEFHFSYQEHVVDSSLGEEVIKEELLPISIAFVGDVMLDRGIRSIVNIHGGGDYQYIGRYFNFLNDFDIVFGNLEGPLSDKGEDLGGMYSFRANPHALDLLSNLNFSVLSVANNHAGDWGVEAFVDTVLRLRSSGKKVVGGGMNRREAESVVVYEVKDKKIGFLGFSDVGPSWLEARESKPGILLANSKERDGIIKRASEEVDLLIVSFHFGEEYQKQPSERQRYLATKAIDSGARLVVGHHPHIIQPVEKYKRGLIAYSLGNFIFDQNFSSETMEGLLLKVTIIDDDISFETENFEITRHFQPRLIVEGTEKDELSYIERYE